MPKFEKGQSGNPRGRPKGIEDCRTRRMQEVLSPQAEALLDRLIGLALDGDVTALRICLDRLLPTLKPCELPVNLPNLPESLTDQGKAILRAMASGELTPSQAAALLQAIGIQARIEEVDQLRARLEAVELTLKHREPHDKP